MERSFVIPEDVIRQQAAADNITHLSTGIAVVDGAKVLVVRRAVGDFLGGNYELPGGGVENGETLLEAVRREMQEETGQTVTEVLGMFPGFDYATPTKPRVRQCNFLVRAAGNVHLSAEHDAYTWVTLADVESLVLTAAMKQSVIDALELAASFEAV